MRFKAGFSVAALGPDREARRVWGLLYLPGGPDMGRRRCVSPVCPPEWFRAEIAEMPCQQGWNTCPPK